MPNNPRPEEPAGPTAPPALIPPVRNATPTADTTGQAGSGNPPDNEEPFEAEVRSALRDVWVLLKFLGRADDARLQAYFKDAGGSPGTVGLRLVSPPCERYDEFLNRLTQIQNDVDNKVGKAPVAPVALTPNAAKPELGDLPFLLWSRDFLAAIAAPATADTIRMTRVFLEHRASPGEGVWPQFKTFWGFGTTPPAPPPEARESQSIRIRGSAAKLARRVTWLNTTVFIITLFTILLSIYALSGHLIMSARDDTIKDIRAVDAKIFEIETHDHAPPPQITQVKSDGGAPAVTLSNVDTSAVTSLCDKVTIATRHGSEGTDEQVKKDPSIAVYEIFPSYGPIPNSKIYSYSSYSDIDVCRHRRRDQIQLFAVGEQLIAWQRIVSGIWLFGRFFGHSIYPADEFSNNMLICAYFTGNKNYPKATNAEMKVDSSNQTPAVHDRCRYGLMEIAEYYGRIPEAILGCITLYVLPCLYGFLGAGVSTLRSLRIKVDASLVNLTERATILQNCLLGIVSGAVVGLFAAYLSKGGALDGIGVSALAFLAGYNVTGLFSMFDDISNRIFKGGPSVAK